MESDHSFEGPPLLPLFLELGTESLDSVAISCETSPSFENTEFVQFTSDEQLMSYISQCDENETMIIISDVLSQEGSGEINTAEYIEQNDLESKEIKNRFEKA